MDRDFNDFVNDLVVEAANRQSGRKVLWVDFEELCRSKEPLADTWKNMARERIQNLGFGKFMPSTDGQARMMFKINAEGISHAAEIRKIRRKPKLRERLLALPYGKGVWEIIKLGLAAVLGALVKAYVG